MLPVGSKSHKCVNFGSCSGRDFSMTTISKIYHHWFATAAVADFAVTKQSFWKISETARASNFKIYRNVALYSLYISTRNDVIICFKSVANRINVFIWGYVRVGTS